MKNEITEKLMKSGEPWTEYRTMTDLAGMDKTEPSAAAAYAGMITHPLVKNLLEKINTWGEKAFTRHNDASYPIYAFSALADFGLECDVPEINSACSRVLEHISGDGGIQTLTNIPKAFGGNNSDTWTWIICDMPTLLYSLKALGCRGNQKLNRAAELLVGICSENGWRCVCDTNLGKFRGPGKKDDPCPVVNIYALKALSLFPELHEKYAESIANGIEMLLSHWEKRGEIKYYLFGVGADFGKIKYPYVWYNILHVLEVLSRYPAAASDKRYKEMLEALTSQADPDGMYRAASMYRSWKDWSFADKKQPSPWLSFLVYRILKRSS